MPQYAVRRRRAVGPYWVTGHRIGEARRPGPGPFGAKAAWTVDTCNGTGYNSMEGYLCSRVCTADMAFGQESKRRGDAARRAEAALGAAGWKSLVVDALPGPRGSSNEQHNSGGVVLAARAQFGVDLQRGMESPELVPGRVAAGVWGGPRAGWHRCVQRVPRLRYRDGACQSGHPRGH